MPEHTSRTFAGTNGDDNLRGKTTNDYMVGDSGNDRINGAYGHDVLFGGSGDDVFVFDRKASSKDNSDVIKDFTSGEDTLELSSAKMLSLQQGFTSENLFFGAKAHDSNDFIIYNQDSGQLFYDRDGSGSGTAQLIATLENHTALKVYDFDII